MISSQSSVLATQSPAFHIYPNIQKQQSSSMKSSHNSGYPQISQSISTAQYQEISPFDSIVVPHSSENLPKNFNSCSQFFTPIVPSKNTSFTACLTIPYPLEDSTPKVVPKRSNSSVKSITPIQSLKKINSFQIVIPQVPSRSSQQSLVAQFPSSNQIESTSVSNSQFEMAPKLFHAQKKVQIVTPKNFTPLIKINKSVNSNLPQSATKIPPYQPILINRSIQPLNHEKKVKEKPSIKQSFQDQPQLQQEKEGEIFIDYKFSPNYSSIGGNYQKHVRWMRPPELFKDCEEISLFGKNLSPSDVIPGDLGDDYFRSTISSLAFAPYIIKGLIKTKEISAVGKYTVTFVWQGVLTNITIDDQFPAKLKQSPFDKWAPCFTHGIGSELWPLILEKAWAKLHGSYSLIDSGLVEESLHDLTGAPTRSIFFKDLNETEREQCWFNIRYGLDKEFITIVTSTNEEPSEKQISLQNQCSLKTFSSYIIIGIVQERNQRFIKIKRPHPISNSEGTIEYDVILGYDEFLNYFTSMTVCYKSTNSIDLNNCRYNSIQLFQESEKPVSKFCISVKIKKSGVYYLQVSQKSIRTLGISKQNQYKPQEYYHNIKLNLYNQQTEECFISVEGACRDLTSLKAIDEHDGIIQRGNYMAVVEVEWRKHDLNCKKVAFGVYGEKGICIQQCS